MKRKLDFTSAEDRRSIRAEKLSHSVQEGSDISSTDHKVLEINQLRDAKRKLSLFLSQHFQPIDCPGFQEVGNGESILKFKIFMPESDNDPIDCMITRRLNKRNAKLKYGSFRITPQNMSRKILFSQNKCRGALRKLCFRKSRAVVVYLTVRWCKFTRRIVVAKRVSASKPIWCLFLPKQCSSNQTACDHPIAQSYAHYF